MLTIERLFFDIKSAANDARQSTELFQRQNKRTKKNASNLQKGTSNDNRSSATVLTAHSFRSKHLPFSCIGRTVLNHHFLFIRNLFNFVEAAMQLSVLVFVQIEMPIPQTLHTDLMAESYLVSLTLSFVRCIFFNWRYNWNRLLPHWLWH